MHTKHKLKIRKQPGNVGFKDFIEGYVSPACSPVQVYILANDNMWYLQKPAQVIEHTFVCDCAFGFPDSFGHSFTAVAIMTEDRPASPIAELPTGVLKSKPVKFKR